MPRPLQVFGWMVQLTGAGFVYIAFFTDIGHAYGPRFTAVWLLLAYMFFAVGRQIYRPPVELLMACPACGRDIRRANRTCPHCKADLVGSRHFPASEDE